MSRIGADAIAACPRRSQHVGTIRARQPTGGRWHGSLPRQCGALGDPDDCAYTSTVDFHRHERQMANATPVRIDIDLELPADLARLKLPEGVDRRLQALLDKQDAGESLSDDERLEAEGLVDLSETLTLLRLRASRVQLGQD